MKQLPSPSLGFSDLTEDECLLITLYRDWRRLGPTRAIAEHKIATLLQRDRSYLALDSLFAVFKEFGRVDAGDHDPTGVLSDAEERLLDLLSDKAPPEFDNDVIRRCRSELAAANIKTRPGHEIPRSGQDELMLRVTQSYQTTWDLL